MLPTEAVQGAVDGITPYYVVPLLRVMVFLCLAMVIMTLVEKVYLAVVVACLKLFRRKPEKQYKWEDMKKDDLEIGDSAYPIVLVQLPMCNEKKALVQEECRRWASKGVNIKCENREHRKGYKAGALKDGMNQSYVKLCEYVVIFDADFQPDPDFLYRTIPYLIHNPNLALVQASWTFVNSDECMLTRMQEMSMEYHFSVEQEVGSAVHAFFGFNGTAGVWRIAALNDAGGWKERTTVEDMDLGCRAALKAWKFLFLSDVKKVSIWKKVYMVYAFFFVNKIVAHIVPFTFFCVVLPATVLVPQVKVPIWGAVYLPLTVAVLNVLPTPRSFHLVVFWMLFENVMSLHRTIATFIGLLEVGRVNEWVITEKLGNAFKTKTGSKPVNKLPRFSIGERLHVLEIIVGLYLVFCGWYNFCYGNNHYYVYLFVQGVSFFVIGFGYIGAFGTTS
nr:glucomannan 4-beta-mannosyltransferase 9-like [Ipomoea batatas]